MSTTVNRDAFAPTRERLRELSAPLSDEQLAKVIEMPVAEIANVRNFNLWDVTNTLLLMDHLGLTPADIFITYEGDDA